jgi:CheY-like chemotaxis protein
MATVLLVEDSEPNRDTLARRLAQRGYDVLVAADGAQGVERARAEAPDVILLDLTLPVLDGWEAARRLKGDAKTHGIPIIALSAHAMAQDRERALAAGCDAYETKPVDLERLLAAIGKLLAR